MANTSLPLRWKLHDIGFLENAPLPIADAVVVSFNSQRWEWKKYNYEMNISWEREII